MEHEIHLNPNMASVFEFKEKYGRIIGAKEYR
jgi:hypothetical protein